MYEPYLNKEKQYLKMNAELDNRFKEIEPIKSETSDVAKPRLNVFGISKTNNQPTKSIVHVAKQKKIGTKLGSTPKASYENNFSDAGLKNVDSVDVKSNSANNESKKKSSENVSQSVEIIGETDLHVTSTTTSNEPTLIKKNISSDGLIKFLKSKVAILKQELEQCQQENAKNLRAYDGCVESNKKILSQVEQLTKENATLKTHIDKLQQTNNIQETVLKEKEIDIATLNKESVALKKQLKETNRLHSTLDKRFQKSQDDLEHLKKNLANAQDAERQQRAVNLQQKNFFEDQIKILSKQRSGLISAYKRQLLLLDNLKRQNLCLEQSKLLQFAEKDFMKILDWNSN